MNKEKLELLNNPVVKEIALDFVEEIIQFNSRPFRSDYGEKFEEYKQSQQPTKEWEILSMYIPGDPNRYFEKHGEYFGYGESEANHCKRDFNKLSNLGYVIHSIKRLSDGEVFTVGDETQRGKIDGFSIHPTIGILMVVIGNIGFSIRELAISPPRKPLFTTEDGKEIFSGDKYWTVFNEDWVKDCHNLIAFEIYGPHDAVLAEKYPGIPPNGQNCFSTKEAAEEYVLMNKPMLSLSDIKYAINPHGTNRAWELIQQKAKSKMKF